MSEIRRISRLCISLAEKYGTRNPFELADAMGIRVVSCPDFQKLEGMYKVILGERFVFLNGNLRRRRAGEVLAHELGHDVLHREMGEHSIVQDHFLVDMTLKPEYEANLFAAELLVSQEKLVLLMKSGATLEEAAKKLKVHPVLVELKLRILEETGRASLENEGENGKITVF